MLVVVGILVGLSLPLLQSHTHRAMLKKTKEHQRLIHGALKTYQQTQPNQTLPCPADPKASSDAQGHANCTLKTQEGILPYKTLGLSEAVAKDGYNRYFTYGVEHNLTRPMDDFGTIKGGHIQVFDEKGRNVLDSRNAYNFISFVLVSHGESGEGAYSPVGKRIPVKPAASLLKKTNANGLPEYYSGGEDHVYWVSQIVFRSAGGPH